jgi:hypothetical protein
MLPSFPRLAAGEGIKACFLASMTPEAGCSLLPRTPPPPSRGVKSQPAKGVSFSPAPTRVTRGFSAAGVASVAVHLHPSAAVAGFWKTSRSGHHSKDLAIGADGSRNPAAGQCESGAWQARALATQGLRLNARRLSAALRSFCFLRNATDRRSDSAARSRSRLARRMISR